MKRSLVLSLLAVAVVASAAIGACDKTVAAPDVRVDTVRVVDTTLLSKTDTLVIQDTLVKVDTTVRVDTAVRYDTVTTTVTVTTLDTTVTYDTIVVTPPPVIDTLVRVDTTVRLDTVLRIDTVTRIDTVHAVDTVTTVRADTVLLPGAVVHDTVHDSTWVYVQNNPSNPLWGGDTTAGLAYFSGGNNMTIVFWHGFFVGVIAPNLDAQRDSLPYTDYIYENDQGAGYSQMAFRGDFPTFVTALYALVPFTITVQVPPSPDRAPRPYTLPRRLALPARMIRPISHGAR